MYTGPNKEPLYGFINNIIEGKDETISKYSRKIFSKPSDQDDAKVMDIIVFLDFISNELTEHYYYDGETYEESYKIVGELHKYITDNIGLTKVRKDNINSCKHGDTFELVVEFFKYETQLVFNYEYNSWSDFKLDTFKYCVYNEEYKTKRKTERLNKEHIKGDNKYIKYSDNESLKVNDENVKDIFNLLVGDGLLVSRYVDYVRHISKGEFFNKFGFSSLIVNTDSTDGDECTYNVYIRFVDVNKYYQFYYREGSWGDNSFYFVMEVFPRYVLEKKFTKYYISQQYNYESILNELEDIFE